MGKIMEEKNKGTKRPKRNGTRQLRTVEKGLENPVRKKQIMHGTGYIKTGLNFKPVLIYGYYSFA